MRTPSSKSRKTDTRRLSSTHTEPTTARPRSKLMLRTNTSSQLKPNASTSLESIEDILKFATGAEEPRSHPSDGSGFQTRKFGTDTMMANGTTGDHPRVVSPEVAGPSTMDTGIIEDMSSNSSEA